MSTIWKKLAKGKRYREEFALAMLKRMIPYQTRAIRKKRGWSQAQLATAANVTQGVISRAEDPDYGNLTLTTIGRIAAGFDLAAIIRFAPFSQLIRYSDSSTEQEFAELQTFEQEVPGSQTQNQGEMRFIMGRTPVESLGTEPQKNTVGEDEGAAQFANLSIPPDREILPERLGRAG